MQWIHFVMLGVMFLPITLLIAFTPYFTRRTESFGITVSEEVFYSEPLKRMRRNFAAVIIILQVALLAICLWGTSLVQDSAKQATWMMIYIFGVVIIHFITLFYFHNKMKRYKAEQLPASIKPSKMSIDTTFRKKKLVISNKWYFIHVLIIIGTAIFTAINYDRFPDQIPFQYDLQGNPTTIRDKSLGTVYMPVIMQLMMTLLFIFINSMIYRSKQQVDTDNPEISLSKNRIFRMRNSVFNVITSLLLVLLFNFMQFTMLYPVDAGVMMAVVIAVVCLVLVGVAILYFTTGQGGSRVKLQAEPSSLEPYGNDESWKLGMFYFDPKDPAIFVEKRMGYGWTINHARPMAWFLFVSIIGTILAVTFLIS
ncbi:DUF5808 domain-containing protein [Paenibacillus urinalis]|uniref:DUF5808 domain-containing protein n=1 Tax=Paenibacillus urinalis TaxID=521520 RepID=A0AAX3MTF8_9BACL|nr:MULTISPECIES: DUF5808 domain-containing protein [Paenibacillus]WDH80901.1 DUF5808 domain-containing protein [Paenibacillus urinalis]WDH96956.1 DUF5808 domain-containing protein [Paenibacillus urinalis]WDI00601.1 DUF5808 domain-containing protein [Paenibacillus urinalis]GAK39277.1 hypothetical protein TCA2_1765 [Paenibacillus sp. TCA20]